MRFSGSLHHARCSDSSTLVVARLSEQIQQEAERGRAAVDWMELGGRRTLSITSWVLGVLAQTVHVGRHTVAVDTQPGLVLGQSCV